ncbi:MAG: P63C domain-containing protein [Acidobacteria bacterium]|nr:P63C domain-containing protein [Acidobacteriota bacterium]
MSKHNDSSPQSKGGTERARRLSSGERREIAQRGADARWGIDLLQATHDGPLEIGDALLMAAVLPSGKRLLAQGTLLRAIGRSRTPKAGTGGLSTGDDLPFFLSADILKQFISDELRLSTTPILFKLKSGQRTVGYDAMLLPMVCEVYLKLRDDLNAKIASGKRSEKKSAKSALKRYEPIIDACDRLTRGLARRGITALVDDATGYRANQTKEDMLRVIAEYISPTLLSWTRKFPPEFFEQIYRLHNWEYKPGSVRRPSYIGKLINKYIYEPLPPGVLEEMKHKLPKNPSGNRRAKLWQTLSIDTGVPHLDRQIADVLMIMRLSEDLKGFEHNFDKIYGKQLQLRLRFMNEIKALSA